MREVAKKGVEENKVSAEMQMAIGADCLHMIPRSERYKQRKEKEGRGHMKRP